MSKTIHGKFLKVSRSCWNKKMSIDSHSESELTYGKGAVAAKLLSSLIKSRTRNKYVGILLPPCCGNLIAFFGTLFSGKVPVMINYSTGTLSNIEIARKKCRADLFLTSKKFIEKLGVDATDDMLFLEDALHNSSLLSKLFSFLAVRFFPPALFSGSDGWNENDSETSVILFTSGSEKEPKAVQLTHKNILSTIAGTRKSLSFSPDEVLLSTLPMFHSFGFVSNILFVTNNMKIVFYPNPLDYKTIGNTAKKYSPTMLLGPPTFFEGYISKCHRDDFKSIRYAITGADKLLEKTRTRFREKFGIQLLQGYGITESSAVAAFETPHENRPDSVGKPLLGTEIKIVNPETEEEMPRNRDGLILLKGDNIMSGYFEDEEKTNEVLKKSWYFTGDIGRLDDDGFLWISGRMKRFVKVGGEMISLTMVESTLSECLPEDCECAVIGIDDEKRGSRIQAFVTTEKKIIRSLRDQLKKLLPHIAIPKDFHVVEEIPKLGSGKNNYRELTRLLEEKSSIRQPPGPDYS